VQLLGREAKACQYTSETVPLDLPTIVIVVFRSVEKCLEDGLHVLVGMEDWQWF
jgi:hypothetical protein